MDGIRRLGRTALIMLTALILPCCAWSASDAHKTAGTLFNRQLLEKARKNAARYPWAADIQKQIVDAAQPWMKYSDDELWDMMFGPTIKRAWQVWSNGYCPSCNKSVPMYNWIARALDQPWKMQCPHCKELFPKNDFFKFYRSGLDEHGIFDPNKADRSLLFNTEHPDPEDPLHLFGVDDGEGYVEGENQSHAAREPGAARARRKRRSYRAAAGTRRPRRRCRGGLVRRSDRGGERGHGR
jgi:hypothetical protein